MATSSSNKPARARPDERQEAARQAMATNELARTRIGRARARRTSARLLAVLRAATLDRNRREAARSLLKPSTKRLAGGGGRGGTRQCNDNDNNNNNTDLARRFARGRRCFQGCLWGPELEWAARALAWPRALARSVCVCVCVCVRRSMTRYERLRPAADSQWPAAFTGQRKCAST